MSTTFYGCGTLQPNIQGATQVGGREPATWVFVESDTKEDRGIYRCKETESGPVCTRAAIEKRGDR